MNNNHIFKKGKIRKEHYSYSLARSLFAPLLLPFFLRMRVSANKISLISLLYGAGISVIYAFSSPGLWIAASILMLGTIILDVCDGPVARTKGTVNELGIFTDMITGKLILVIMFIMMAVSFKGLEFIGIPLVFFSLVSFIYSEKRKQLFGGLRQPFLHSSRFNLFNLLVIIIMASILDLIFATQLFRFLFFVMLVFFHMINCYKSMVSVYDR